MADKTKKESKENKVKQYSKLEFEAMVAEKMDISKANAKDAVNAFIDSITEIVKKGESVSFTGFGKFSVGKRAARSGRNPKTGAPLMIKAAKLPKFTAGKLLKDAANGK
ncbi:HU family DNA-binding protein [Cysteiniphilum sp. SYW-8]|uniref:HU family DNA-binding protein n=1 Tax=Cysteiniphilum sp. SYW-8 TaxID=2610890 RepID=UPI00123CBE88|nr:HU family DNA-binding protein [Cysteiniphilum sp. SYW-8]